MATTYEVRAIEPDGTTSIVGQAILREDAIYLLNHWFDWGFSRGFSAVCLLQSTAGHEQVEITRWRLDPALEAELIDINDGLRKHGMEPLTSEQEGVLRDPRIESIQHALAMLDDLEQRGIDVATMYAIVRDSAW